LINPESCVVDLMEIMAIAPLDSTKVENTTRTVLLWTEKARALFNLAGVIFCEGGGVTYQSLEGFTGQPHSHSTAQIRYFPKIIIQQSHNILLSNQLFSEAFLAPKYVYKENYYAKFADYPNGLLERCDYRWP
jgi:hypothetical protein